MSATNHTGPNQPNSGHPSSGRPDPGQPGSNGEPTVLRLSKGRHTWFFRYAEGDEGTLRATLAELAGRAETPFDWFDAALVTHQLKSRLKPGLDRVDGRMPEFADPTQSGDE